MVTFLRFQNEIMRPYLISATDIKVQEIVRTL